MERGPGGEACEAGVGRRIRFILNDPAFRAGGGARAALYP